MNVICTKNAPAAVGPYSQAIDCGDFVFLSGGEKVRCMLSRMMLSGANVVLLDQPTNHLDMESIQAVNKGLEAFPGVVLLASHDHEMLSSVCNRVIAFQPDGTIVDRYGTYDEYLTWLEQQKEKS